MVKKWTGRFHDKFESGKFDSIKPKESIFLLHAMVYVRGTTMADLTGKEKKLGHKIREGYPEFRVKENQESFLRIYRLKIYEKENMKVDRGCLQGFLSKKVGAVTLSRRKYGIRRRQICHFLHVVCGTKHNSHS